MSRYDVQGRPMAAPMFDADGQKLYRSLPVQHGSVVDRYVRMAAETNLETVEQTLERIIRMADPGLSLLGEQVDYAECSECGHRHFDNATGMYVDCHGCSCPNGRDDE